LGVKYGGHESANRVCGRGEKGRCRLFPNKEGKRTKTKHAGEERSQEKPDKIEAQRGNSCPLMQGNSPIVKLEARLNWGNRPKQTDLSTRRRKTFFFWREDLVIKGKEEKAIVETLGPE